MSTSHPTLHPYKFHSLCSIDASGPPPHLRMVPTLLQSLAVALSVTIIGTNSGWYDHFCVTDNDRGITARLPGTINHDFFHCDRSQFRTDICNLRGDIRMETHNKSKSFVLYAQDAEERMEKLKPYTRKWEEGSMSTVNEVMLTSQIDNPNRRLPKCDVHHKVPGVIFSTGGYTGNLYHEFNDGLIPLFITSQHLRWEVVVIISSFHDWWYTKYQDVVGQISKYKLLDLDSDKRVHCFPEIEASALSCLASTSLLSSIWFAGI
ncbi:hypothetical protein M758_UG076400 [Ceratodon purpureus]|nr:hypothetical protein M758_UG076400 [Ceratodon purpureus]